MENKYFFNHIIATKDISRWYVKVFWSQQSYHQPKVLHTIMDSVSIYRWIQFSLNLYRSMTFCFIQKKITKSIWCIIILLCFNIFDILIMNLHFRLLNRKSWVDHLTIRRRMGIETWKWYSATYNDRHGNSSWIFTKSGEVLVLITRFFLRNRSLRNMRL